MEEYTIERLAIRESAGVTRCMHGAYGDNYPSHEVYEPEEIARLNISGDMLSVVAKTPEGEIVGHYALIIENREARLGELGQAVVVPGHRGRGLMGKMRSLLERLAVDEGLVGLYSAPVTTHTYSQRVNFAAGSRETAIVLGYVPQTITFREIPGGTSLPQRETVIVFFKYLGTPQRTEVYVPRPHRSMVRAIYDHLDAPRTVRDGEDAPLAEKSDLEFRKSQQWACAWIGFSEYGSDFLRIFGSLTGDLFCKGIETIHVDLPLTHPLTPAYCATLEEMGFFFIGIIPSFLAGSDSLRLQYLDSPIIDFSLINVHSPFAEKLIRYVRGEYEKGEERKAALPRSKSLRALCERTGP
jgi:serine/threonine-protein kinase RsbW